MFIMWTRTTLIILPILIMYRLNLSVFLNIFLSLTLNMDSNHLRYSILVMRSRFDIIDFNDKKR